MGENMIETDEGVPVAFPEQAWPLMRKALQHIADHPAEFYMAEFVLTPAEIQDEQKRVAYLRDIGGSTGLPMPSCGTVACLAGHITLAADPEAKKASEETALDALGISDGHAAYPVLWNIFYETWIETYEQLAEALCEHFTFPEPLPTPSMEVDR